MQAEPKSLLPLLPARSKRRELMQMQMHAMQRCGVQEARSPWQLGCVYPRCDSMCCAMWAWPRYKVYAQASVNAHTLASRSHGTAHGKAATATDSMFVSGAEMNHVGKRSDTLFQCPAVCCCFCYCCCFHQTWWLLYHVVLFSSFLTQWPNFAAEPHARLSFTLCLGWRFFHPPIPWLILHSCLSLIKDFLRKK